MSNTTLLNGFQLLRGKIGQFKAIKPLISMYNPHYLQLFFFFFFGLLSGACEVRRWNWVVFN